MRNLKELLAEALSKTEIFEMAYERSEYVKALFNLRIQLIENVHELSEEAFAKKIKNILC